MRELLVTGVLSFLHGEPPPVLAEVREQLEQTIDDAGHDALAALQASLRADHGWAYYPPDPLARRIHHLLADRFLDCQLPVGGGQRFEQLAGVSIAIFANHLSYADANVIDVLMQRAGHPVAGRLTALAGPKVFSSRERRFSSLCFGTVKVPQSAEVSSEEAILNAREVARAARRAIAEARQRLAAGDTLLLFGEGTRSRTGGMQPMRAGVARYVDGPGTWVLPMALSGSESLFPVGHSTIQRARARLEIGAPISAERLFARADGDRRTVMDAIGLAIAAMLPSTYRGAYANPNDYRAAAAVLGAARRES